MSEDVDEEALDVVVQDGIREARRAILARLSRAEYDFRLRKAELDGELAALQRACEHPRSRRWSAYQSGGEDCPDCGWGWSK